MSRLSGWLTSEARAYVEAVRAAARPGRYHPDTDQPVVDTDTDRRTAPQRLHDGIALALKSGMASGALGQHRGLPVTVIATTTVADLQQAAQAAADPAVAMPPAARTGGGSALPMRDLIEMARDGALHYLAVFDDHSDRPLYLGRATRIASADQRIVCHARDRGCTRPNCAVAGYDCEVHHAPPWYPDGRTDTDALFFACPADNTAAEHPQITTTPAPSGRLAWTNGTDPPEVNHLHHPDELLEGSPPRGDPE